MHGQQKRKFSEERFGPLFKNQAVQFHWTYMLPQTWVAEQAVLKELELSWPLTIGPISRSEMSITKQSLKKLDHSTLEDGTHRIYPKCREPSTNSGCIKFQMREGPNEYLLPFTTFPAEENRFFSINDGKIPKQRALPNMTHCLQKNTEIFSLFKVFKNWVSDNAPTCMWVQHFHIS